MQDFNEEFEREFTVIKKDGNTENFDIGFVDSDYLDAYFKKQLRKGSYVLCHDGIPNDITTWNCRLYLPASSTSEQEEVLQELIQNKNKFASYYSQSEDVIYPDNHIQGYKAKYPQLEPLDFEKLNSCSIAHMVVIPENNNSNHNQFFTIDYDEEEIEENCIHEFMCDDLNELLEDDYDPQESFDEWIAVLLHDHFSVLTSNENNIDEKTLWLPHELSYYQRGILFSILNRYNNIVTSYYVNSKQEIVKFYEKDKNKSLLNEIDFTAKQESQYALMREKNK